MRRVMVGYIRPCVDRRILTQKSTMLIEPSVTVKLLDFEVSDLDRYLSKLHTRQSIDGD